MVDDPERPSHTGSSRVTGDRHYRERGEEILDDRCLYQQVWSPRWLLCALAQEPVVYMSILNTRAHQRNRNDYPMIGLFVSTGNGSTWQHKGWREYIRMFPTVEGPDGVHTRILDFPHARVIEQ